MYNRSLNQQAGTGPRGRSLFPSWILLLVLGLTVSLFLPIGPDAEPVKAAGENLLSSDITASQKTLGPDEKVTFTITLRNTGTEDAEADVTGVLPPELAYVSGSATGGGDPVDDHIDWTDVPVAADASVELAFQAEPATQVSTDTVVTTGAAIMSEHLHFIRFVQITLVPSGGPPPDEPDLIGSYKTASRRVLSPDETLTYTIKLRNSGSVTATADVTDEVPSDLVYVPGSASNGGSYDPDTETVTWSSVKVGPEEDQSLTFAVTGASVDMSTIVTNKAVIAYEDEALERHTEILLIPHPVGDYNLHGSYKYASQGRVQPGDELTYTIRLHNSGTISVTATVTDPIPSEMSYVAGSASDGGIYDADDQTLTWEAVNVPAGESVSLTFAVTPKDVDEATLVVNKATIVSDDRTLKRSFAVVVTPESTDDDVKSPKVDNVTIDEKDVLESASVTLHITATDDVGLNKMYIREWQLMTEPFPHWEVVQSSGWVPYQTDYAWTLNEESGTHYVGVWVNDDAGNKSRMNSSALDYASLILPDETIDKGDLMPYLVHYEAGESVDVELTPSDGDADLYVWYPHSFGQPDQKSTNSDSATDAVSFETPREGTYLFLVYGYTDATYDFSITPGGGPEPLSLSETSAVSFSGQATTAKSDELIAEPVLSSSGIDPLSSVTTPAGPYVLYLPLVVRE